MPNKMDMGGNKMTGGNKMMGRLRISAQWPLSQRLPHHARIGHRRSGLSTCMRRLLRSSRRRRSTDRQQMDLVVISGNKVMGGNKVMSGNRMMEFTQATGQQVAHPPRVGHPELITRVGHPTTSQSQPAAILLMMSGRSLGCAKHRPWCTNTSVRGMRSLQGACW